jgi:hypothetical protein
VSRNAVCKYPEKIDAITVTYVVVFNTDFPKNLCKIRLNKTKSKIRHCNFLSF